MKKQVILNLCTTILVLSGCGIFKNRTVHVDKLNYLSKSEETTRVKGHTAHVDTGTVKKITAVHTTDSTSTETNITPTPGKPIIVDPDGTFHGEAKNVNTKITKKKSATKKSTVDEKKGVTDSIVKDSIGHKKQETRLSKKTKDIVNKPDYGWIWIVAAIVVFVIAVYGLYRKYLRP